MLISATPEALLSASSSSGSGDERLTLQTTLYVEYGGSKGSITMVATNTAGVLSYVFYCSNYLSSEQYTATFNKSSIPDRFWPVLAKLSGSYSLIKKDGDMTRATASFSTSQLKFSINGASSTPRIYEFLLCTVSAE